MLKKTVPPFKSDQPRLSMPGKIKQWYLCFREGRIKSLGGESEVVAVHREV